MIDSSESAFVIKLMVKEQLAVLSLKPVLVPIIVKESEVSFCGLTTRVGGFRVMVMNP